MTWGQWALTNPAGLLWGLLALPIIALHILKPRRIQATVPAIFLWRQVAKPVTAAKPWQNLVPSWLLVAQVLAALLLALLMAGPVRLTPLALAEHTIFVVDGSASMQAADGSPDRQAEAVDRASELRRQVPDGGEASLVVAGANARALLTRSSDAGAFDEALDRIELYDGPADFESAFALAAGLNTGDRPTRVVFVSDGGINTEDLGLAPVGTRYERIGDSATNRGISRLSVEPSSDGLVARIAVRHYGGPPATESVRVDVDGVTVERLTVELADESIENLSVRLPPGELVEVFLESEDSFLLDNRAVGTVARRPEISVLRLGGGNAFLDAALAVIPGLTVDTRAALPETDAGSIDLDALEDIDVIIADRVAVPDELSIPTWLITPPGGGPGGIQVTGEFDRPALVSINPDSPLVSGLDLGDVLLARAQDVSFAAADPGVEVVLGGDEGPLLLVIRRPGADVVYQTFALDESTLPLQAAYPVLVDRIITELAQAALPPARLTVGERLPVDPRLAATITDPNGSSVDVAPGGTAPVAGAMGFWRVEQDGRVPVVVAVNPPPAESAIAPAIDLPFVRGFAEADGLGAQGQVPLRRWVIAALLAVVAAEWLLARRRVGVSARQWQVAKVMRAAVALSLIVVLFNPGITLPTDRVATVFLVDASDSMGVGGVSDGSTFVRDALTAKREAASDDVAGVVAFGQNARLENVVADDPAFSTLSVDVDRTATDLSAALRLGAAALPNDARRRLVLLSDGRATKGDATAEAERLAELGVPVDVVIIEPPSGADAAVASIDAPSLVQVDEALTVATTVTSEIATEATVTLRRDGELVERRTVSLTPGDNRVVFDDVAASTGVMRYQVDVDAAGDPVTLNNRAYAAVPVSGAETVLVVDGEQAAAGATPGVDAARMVALLEAAGLPTETVAVRSLPPLDSLSQYASIVLINVNRLDLADAEVANLTAAVRDLGRGLVTVGGDHTYALGGYRGSDLEELLPVDSEITDPLRRQTVAQVLAIDTSGSMDACH
ncbi:MAG: VWA domain-containing protein, partial [Acidimicrobiia bacterium]|nr:VWA domain-containing protein [Acidimicrobiia bacterium]